jgi:hypothetical protein
MMINMIYKFMIVIFLFIIPQVHCAEDDIQQKAHKHFPNREQAYVKDDLDKIFHPILNADVKIVFDQFFDTMFRKDFPKPIHNNNVIAGGYRCLYIKMVNACSHTNLDDVKKDQLYALYQLMKIHINPLTVHNPELASQILPVEVCANCVMETPSYEHHGSYNEGNKPV